MNIELKKNDNIFNYIIDYKIGEGIYSRVYKCHIDGYYYAMKIYRNDKEYIKAGLQEVKALWMLKNKKRFPQIYDHFVVNDHVIIIQEYLSKNLDHKLYYCTYGIDKIKCIAKELLLGLKDIRNLDNPFIHADLKLDNIIIDNKKVKIIDFSNIIFINKSFIQNICEFINNTIFTKKKLDIQARVYKAPEIILNYEYINKIDIWSIGCILYELFTGNYLFNVNNDIAHIDSIATICSDKELNNFIPLLDDNILNKFYSKYNNIYYYKKKYIDSPNNTLEYLLGEYNLLKEDLNEFINFLKCIFIINPYERWDVDQLLDHPFIK